MSHEWSVDDNCRLPDESEQGRTCSQPHCRRPAIFVMLRRVYSPTGTTTRRWFCCDNREHSYGRRIEDGKILTWKWVNDDAA